MDNIETIVQKVRVTHPMYIKQEPYIDDTGLYLPCEEYVPEGTASAYRMVISKEQFVEMYNKWIKGEENE